MSPAQLAIIEEPGFLLRPASWCLRLTSTLGLSCKHDKHLFADDPPDLNPRDAWRAAGIYDFLKVKKIKQLEEVEDSEPPPAWAEHRHLVLFPFEELEPDDEFVKVLQKPDAEEFSDPERYPMLVVIKITLASSAFEFQDGRVRTLRAIRNLIRLIEKDPSRKLAMPRYVAYFGSLGSPDLVVLVLPEDPRELRAAHTLARTASTLRLAELEQGEFKGTPGYRDCLTEALPGHACVQALPQLAFRDGSQSFFRDEGRFKAIEREQGIRIRFRLRVDCGHETQVVDEMEKLCPGDVHFDTAGPRELSEGPTTAWHYHTLRGTFDSLAAFVSVWQSCWFDHLWRARNLLDSVTVVSFRDDHEGWPHWGPSWAVAKEVAHRLQEIGRQINTFSGEFLNRTQQAEFQSIYNSFLACFFRQDLLGTAQDLFPFFRQLGTLLESDKHWRKYLLPPSPDTERNESEEEKSARIVRKARFDASFNDLVSHVSRAVRNRIEHRSTVSDPPFPQTLRDGCCKVISAYTVMVYLCWELFRNGEEPFAKADHFAACISAGTDGRVICQELFPDFRRFVERLEGGTASPIRPLLLRVSGKSLLRPEESIAHCMHEMAELSPWIERGDLRKLRKALNSWVLQETIGRYCDLSAELKEISPSERDRVWVPFFGHFGSYCLARFNLECGRNDPSVVAHTNLNCTQHIQETLSAFHPVELVDHLYWAFRNIGSREKILTEYKGHDSRCELKKRDQELPYEVGECARAAADSERLYRHLQTFKGFVTEVVADVGMWSGMYALLSPGWSLGPDERFDHLKRIFLSIFTVASDAASNGKIVGRLRRLLVRRWAIQAAAALPSTENWQQRMREVLELHEDRVGSATLEDLAEAGMEDLQFGGPESGDSLVRLLRSFKPYGGGADVPFADVDAPPHNQILTKIQHCWNCPDGDRQTARTDLLWNLWALSTRFAIPRLLEPVA